MARLVDTNVLVYRFDPRHPVKQRIASEVLRAGLIGGDLVLPHQAVVEFVAAVTRARPDLGNRPLVRGVSAYQLSWFDAHLWAYAEVHGIPEILSEDFEHGRHYGRVRVTDPFLTATDHVNELPPLYAT